MSQESMHISSLSLPTQEWSLFLDRDGVINERIPDAYVIDWKNFVFLPGVITALKSLSMIFGRMFIVTNQQGIGRKLMEEQALHQLHQAMLNRLAQENVFFDSIYHCPHLASESCGCRKPAIGMAIQAKRDFPDVDFQKSVMAGDMLSDIQFGRNAGMVTVMLSSTSGPTSDADFHFPDLASWTAFLINELNKAGL